MRGLLACSTQDSRTRIVAQSWFLACEGEVRVVCVKEDRDDVSYDDVKNLQA